MSIKAINATTQQLSKSIKKSMGKQPFAVLRAYAENPKVFKQDKLSKKAITAELCDRFSASKKQKIVSGELLSKYNLSQDAKLQDLSNNMVSTYIHTTPASANKFDTSHLFLIKEDCIAHSQNFMKEAKALKKQTSNDVKDACKQVINILKKNISNLSKIV